MSRKRWVALAVAAVLFLGMVYGAARLGPVGTMGAGPWEENLLQGQGTDKIAVVEVEGEIVESSEGASPLGAAAEDLVSQLRQAQEDDAVKAVILDINTPGGSVVASDEVYRRVLELRRSGKPVVAAMGEVAASGGYFVAAGADRIVANPSTFTGSIGVILVLVNLERAAGKIGVRPVIIKAGRLKDLGSPFRSLTLEERRILQGLIGEAHDRFIGVVAEGRHLPEADVREIADGRPLSGLQAERLGLVDRLGDFDDAVAEAEDLAGVDGASVVEYQRPFSIADLFSGGFPGLQSPLQDLERRVGVTGPVLKYLYVA